MANSPTILIVDDQPHLRELFSEEMLDEGYSVVGADDAEAAKRVVKQSRPDLVLLDLYLNGFEGWDLLRDIKQSDPHLPVLIVTAYDNYHDDPRTAKADGYIVKDFNAFGRLKRTIAQLLRQECSSTGSTMGLYE